MGNTLRWQTEYLGRQLPVLEARDGFPRKVKPLVRLGERETAAYCLLRGIDYIVEECPMAAGNKHLAYKAALNDIEVESPGAKHDFYFGFLERASAHFRAGVERDRGELAPCSRCGSPTDAGGVRLLPPGRAGGRAGARALLRPARSMTERPLEAGEPVLLVDRKGRRYLFDLAGGREFHTHAGVIAHDDIIGAPEGTQAAVLPGHGLPGGAADPGRRGAEDVPGGRRSFIPRTRGRS